MPGTALGQGDAILEAEDGGEVKKQQTVRYSKRPLLFVGDTETQRSLLIWSCVGALIMHIHYRLFKHVSGYSDIGEEGYTDFGLFPGCKPKRNPAILALAAIANMMFDPNGLGFAGPHLLSRRQCSGHSEFSLASSANS